MNSEQDSYLLSGVFASALLMIESKACGSQSILRESFGGGACSCSSIRSMDVVPLNGGEPVINSKAVHASAYSSVAADGAMPAMAPLFGARLVDRAISSEVTLKFVVPFGDFKPGETLYYTVPTATTESWGALCWK